MTTTTTRSPLNTLYLNMFVPYNSQSDQLVCAHAAKWSTVFWRCSGQPCDLWQKCVSPSDSFNVTERCKINRPVTFWLPTSLSASPGSINVKRDQQCSCKSFVMPLNEGAQHHEQGRVRLRRQTLSAFIITCPNGISERRCTESSWRVASGRNEKSFVSVVPSRQQ